MDSTSVAVSAESARLVRVFNFISRWSLYLLFFLVPVFFLPWTTEIFEINKQIALVILTALATMAWLGGMVVGKQLAFKGGWLNVFPLLFLAGVLISSFFSLAGYQTWVGQAVQEYTSFLTLASFWLLFYVLMNSADGKHQQRNLMTALFLSAGLAGLVTLLSMLNLFYLPFDFAQMRGFNSLGTINSFGLFMMAVMFVGLAMWSVSDGNDGIIPRGLGGILWKVLVFFVSLVALLTLTAIDFWVFWVLAIAGVVLLLTFHFVYAKRFPSPRRFGLPILVFLVSLLLLFFQTPFKPGVPLVVTPSYATSWNITKQVLSFDGTRLLFGSGPGTFAFDYDQFKPAAVNQTYFWNMRFDRSKSHFLTSLATFGVLTTAAAVLFFLMLALKALERLLFEKDHEEWKMTFVIFTGWSLLALYHLLYSSNLTLHFLFFAMSGLLASQVIGLKWQKKFAQAPKAALLASFLFVVLAVGVLAGVFVSHKRYTAELAFAKAVQADASQEPLSQVIANLVRATKANGLSDIYYRNLSSALLVQAANVLAGAKGEELTDGQIKQVNALVAASVNAANTATQIEPNNVSNWVTRGAIYRDLMNFVGNAENFAVATFSQAALLEPINPTHYVSLGQIHLQMADRAAALAGNEDEELAKTAIEARNQALATAEQAFNTAARLKPDYAPAYYYLAAVYERQGRLAEEATLLSALYANDRTNVGLGFELAILLLRLQELDAAKAAFESVLNLAPDYSNAMWFLASVYELQGNPQKALELLEKVANLNPDNQLVAKRLERMRAGEITTFIPKPVEEGEQSAIEVEGGEITDKELPEGAEEQIEDIAAEVEAEEEEASF